VSAATVAAVAEKFSVRLLGSRATEFKTRDGAERFRGAEDLSVSVGAEPCGRWADQRTMFTMDGREDGSVGIP
jgi:hypothetical protein